MDGVSTMAREPQRVVLARYSVAGLKARLRAVESSAVKYHALLADAGTEQLREDLTAQCQLCDRHVSTLRDELARRGE